MGKAITITRADLTVAELRAAAAQAKDASAARRMLCLAMVLEGADRTSAAETCGMQEARRFTLIKKRHCACPARRT
jgi:hypothetical protein